jgi:DNA invertase Pin-like site-specific DNA recombinase
MRVGIYARVSTSDKNQNPETQILPLREFCQTQGWTIAGEFVDKASATDLRGRREWHKLLDAAAKRKLDLGFVWKLDRAFRSVAHASTTLQDLKRWGVGLRSYTEPWADTTSAQGELVFNLLATFAQFERSLIAERVRAGMARAKKQGRHVGRPSILASDGIAKRWAGIRERILAGELSHRDAARALGIGKATVSRLMRTGT